MRTHRARRGPVVLIIVLLALAGCGSGSGSDALPPGMTTVPPSSTRPVTTTTTARAVVVRAYFLQAEVLGPVARTGTGPAVATAAIRGLLAGPTAAERAIGLTSAVPAGTALLSVRIATGVATVDLSNEFTSGGGSASMMARVAQVVFTLTQFASVRSVRFEVEGKPLTTLGGEGLLLAEPQTRADWETFAPAILVESPLPFAQVSSPVRISGTANTFEAAFRIIVTDGDGRIVYDEPAMATSGSGTRGTFTIDAAFRAPRAGVGEIVVFEESAADGSRQHLSEIPIRIR